MSNTNPPPAAEQTAGGADHLRGGTPPRLLWGLGAIVLAGLLVRLLLAPLVGAPGDSQYYQQIGISAVREGLGAIYTRDALRITDPPVYVYLLAADGWVRQALGGLAGLPWPPADLDLPFLILQKLNSIIADLVATTVLALTLWPRLGVGRALAAAATYGLNPALIYTSGFWGQADGVLMAILTSAFCAIVARRPVLAGVLLGLGVATKPQAAFFVLILGLFLLAQAPAPPPTATGRPGRPSGDLLLRWGILPVLAGGAVLGGLLAPFLLGGSAGRGLDPYTRAMGAFSLVELSAFNVWWLVFGVAGNGIRDTIAILGPVTARQLGVSMLGVMLILVVLLYQRALRRVSGPGGGDAARAYSTALALAATALAFFLFPTQVHERYSLYIYPPLLLAAVWRRTGWRPALALVGALSVCTLLDLYFAAPLVPLTPETWQLLTAGVGPVVAVVFLAVEALCLGALIRLRPDQVALAEPRADQPARPLAHLPG